RSPQVSASRFREGGFGGGGIASALREQEPAALFPSPRAFAPPSIRKKKPASYLALAGTSVSKVAVRSKRAPRVHVVGDTLIAREIRMSFAVQLTLMELLTGVP